MSVEQFANAAQTTINQVGGIGAGDTSVTVSSNTGFPANASFRIRIDSELILVTAGQGGVTWTITRGIESTTPAAHANGATVTQVVTNGGLLNAFMTKIDEIVLGASQATLTFPNLVASIPQGYRHLQIIGTGRSDAAVQFTNLSINFNSDTAAHYLGQLNYGNNNLAAGFQTGTLTATPFIGYIPGSSGTANEFAIFEIIIPVYSGTTTIKHAQCRFSTFGNNAAANEIVGVGSAIWNATSAITALTLLLASGNFISGTVATLYGLP